MSENQGAPNTGLTATPPAAQPPADNASTGTATAKVTETTFEYPKNWKEGLPKEYQDDLSMKLVHDIPTLAKNYVNAQKMIGAEKIVIPGKHATEDDWRGVFNKLGLPDDVKKYDIKSPEGTDAASMDGFKQAAYKAGILPKQAEKIAQWYAETNSGYIKDAEQRSALAQEEQMGKLRTEWGMAFDKNISKAQTTFQQFADPDTTKFLNESGLANNPTLIRLFAKIGSAMGEDSVRGAPNRGNDSSLYSPGDAQKKINSIQADKSGPYFDNKHPGHKDAVNEMQELFKMAYPPKK